MERSNKEWLAALSQDGPDREAALADLRDQLLKGLRYSMADRSKVREEDLQDFVQDALLRILNGLDTFRGESQFTTWAQKIAVRVAFTELRRRRWRDVSLDELTENVGELLPRDAPDLGGGPEVQATRRMVLETVRRMISEDLTDRQRRAMTAVLQGMSPEDLARRMGTNRNALYKLLHDARQRMLKQMTSEGLNPQDLLSAFDAR